MGRVSKAKLPSAAQAKMIAIWWAKGRSVNIMKQAPEGRRVYNDPTVLACLKGDWLVASGGLPYFENGYGYEPHALSAAGLLALESYLQKLRHDSLSTAPK